jgi:hypothetical protein
VGYVLCFMNLQKNLIGRSISDPYSFDTDPDTEFEGLGPGNLEFFLPELALAFQLDAISQQCCGTVTIYYGSGSGSGSGSDF